MSILGWTAGSIAAIVGGLAATSAAIRSQSRAAVPADGAFADMPGVRLHHVDRGSGVPVIEIHGLMGQMRNFHYGLTDLLARDYRVIAIDRPGWGYSRLSGRRRPGIAEQADMIAGFIVRNGIDRPVLVGHSLGGAISLALAIRHPDAVRGLALIAPLTQPMAEAPPAFRGLLVPAALRPAVAWTLAPLMATLAGAEKTREIFAPEPVPGDFGTRAGALLGRTPEAFLAGAHELAVASGEVAALVPHYPSVRPPVAILFGRADMVLDAKIHGTATAALIPGAQCTIVEGGHMLPVTQPEQTSDWVRATIAAMADGDKARAMPPPSIKG